LSISSFRPTLAAALAYSNDTLFEPFERPKAAGGRLAGGALVARKNGDADSPVARATDANLRSLSGSILGIGPQFHRTTSPTRTCPKPLFSGLNHHVPPQSLPLPARTS